MYIWSDNASIAPPLPTFSSALQADNGLHRISSYHTIDIDTPPVMLRKASKLFTRHSSTTNALKKQQSGSTLEQASSPDPMYSIPPPNFTMRPVKKKRSLATVLSQIEPSSTDSEGELQSSSTSTFSVHTSSTCASETPSAPMKVKKPKAKLDKKRKTSIPRWEKDEPSEDVSQIATTSKASYLQGNSDTSIANDQHTSEMLDRFYPSAAPTFFPFPAKETPKNILDLGCGPQGTWVHQAATHWRAGGTKVTGLDLFEAGLILKDLPITFNVNSIRFLQGDFLSRLPFENNSFDLVRMAGLNLCIPEAQWDHVIREAYRVLRAGGVLEIIDDEMIWPYLKALPTTPVAPRTSVESLPPVSLNVATGSKHYRVGSKSGAQQKETQAPVDAFANYDHNVDSSNTVEELFEKMLWFNHGIHPRPHEFIQDRITKVFGGHDGPSNVPRVFKVALPPVGFVPRERELKGDKTAFGSFFTVEWDKKKPDNRVFENAIISEFGPPSPASLPETLTPKAAKKLLGCDTPTRLGDKRDITGLLLSSEASGVEGGSSSVDRFAVMEPLQMEMAICKNLHLLLSSRKALHQYISELQEGDDQTSKDEISSALWDYEWFRRTRFNLPTTPKELSFDLADPPSKPNRLSVESNKRSSMVIEPLPAEELTDLTWVRKIRVFHGVKPQTPS